MILQPWKYDRILAMCDLTCEFPMYNLLHDGICTVIQLILHKPIKPYFIGI